MKYIGVLIVGLTAVSGIALAQAPDESMERALAPAPRQIRSGTARSSG